MATLHMASCSTSCPVSITQRQRFLLLPATPVIHCLHRGTRRRRTPSISTYAEQKQRSVSLETYSAPSDKLIQLRSEAEAPFRVVRLTFSGFFVVSASVAALIGTTQLIGALGGAPNALPLGEVAGGLAIDLGAIALFGYFFKKDAEARDKQIARITREEELGGLRLELANKKMLRMAQLRKFARPVIVAGSASHVKRALEAAEPFKDALVERGVLVVPVVMNNDSGQQEGTTDDNVELPPLKPDDLRWRATAMRSAEWSGWFEKQMALANKTADDGLYVGLRMDGRVRSSGKGIPPWQIFSMQLPPTSGMWTGFFDGFDGRV